MYRTLYVIKRAYGLFINGSQNLKYCISFTVQKIAKKGDKRLTRYKHLYDAIDAGSDHLRHARHSHGEQQQQQQQQQQPHRNNNNNTTTASEPHHHHVIITIVDCALAVNFSPPAGSFLLLSFAFDAAFRCLRHSLKGFSSKRGFHKPHKLINQSETLTAVKEKTGQTMVMRCLVCCCFLGVVWCLQRCLQRSKWGAGACLLHVLSQVLCAWLWCDSTPENPSSALPHVLKQAGAAHESTACCRS
jgi:hypothetical protein